LIYFVSLLLTQQSKNENQYHHRAEALVYAAKIKESTLPEKIKTTKKNRMVL